MIAGFSWSRLVGGVLLAAFTVLLPASVARAARVAIQVPFIEADSKISEGRRNKFHDPLVSGLKEAAGSDTTVITGEEVRFALGDKPSLIDCHEGACLQKVADPKSYGIAELDGHGKVARLVEKPAEPRSDLALVGVYLFTPAVFDSVKAITPSARGELEITDAIQHMIDRGLRVEPHQVKGWW